MEIKVDPAQPFVTGEGLFGEAQDLKDHSLFKPVEKIDQEVSRELKKEDEVGKEGNPENSFQLSKEAVENLVEETRGLLNGLPSAIDLDFEVDDTTGEVIVSVLNKDTEEVIRQIPAEEMVKVRQRMIELRGVIYDEKA